MSIERARAKWERKTAQAGERWKAGVTGKASEYCKALAQKFGVSEGACMAAAGRRWQEGVGAVTPSEFQSAVAGKGAKWAEKFVRGLST